MFTAYEDWASHESFDAFVHTGSYSKHTHEPAAILTGLLDLATYFCLWTEASTLRHMPESLWFFFWCDTVPIFHSRACEVMPSECRTRHTSAYLSPASVHITLQ